MAPHQKTKKWVGAATGQHTNTLALKKQFISLAIKPAIKSKICWGCVKNILIMPTGLAMLKVVYIHIQ